MRINPKILFLVFLFCSSFVFSQDSRTFELVESIPEETILDNPNIRNTHQVWLEMINSAKYQINIEQFYITSKKGEMLEDILDAIVNAAKRGVKVNIIVDSKFFKNYPGDVNWLEAESPNITKHVIDFGRLAGGIQHAKFFMIDTTEMFMGSQNFDWRAVNHIHELGVRIKVPEIVKMYNALFKSDWLYCELNDGEPWLKIFPKDRFRTTYNVYDSYYDTLIIHPTMSPPHYILMSGLSDEKNLIQLIDSAKENVCLQFLTYKTSLKSGGYYVIDSALVKAAARGVKVKLIVSDWSIGEFAIGDLKRLAEIPNIEVKYSSIPEWSGGHIPYARVEHLKIVSADNDECWIGTANAEKSYFRNSRNVGVVVHNKKLASEVKKIFMKGWNGPYTYDIVSGKEYAPRKKE
jgi:phosphatidylserine/phosphatidylglycerophosphate/cardiolipin synthase-like enzyme